MAPKIVNRFKHTKINIDNLTGVPKTNGAILIRHKRTGAVNVSMCGNITNRFLKARAGEVGRALEESFEEEGVEGFEFYYIPGTELSFPTSYVAKYAIEQNLIGMRAQRVRYSQPDPYKLYVVTHRPTGYYMLVLRSTKSQEFALKSHLTRLNEYRNVNHRINNLALRAFTVKYGPFKNLKNFEVWQSANTYSGHTEAVKAAREIAKARGTRQLLTARVVKNSEWELHQLVKDKSFTI